MDSSLWARFAQFIKESIIQRTKQSISGIAMGGVSSYHILWIGPLAENLVGGVGWIVKGAGTVVLAFFSGLATSYAGYLIERHKETQKKVPLRKKKRA